VVRFERARREGRESEEKRARRGERGEESEEKRARRRERESENKERIVYFRNFYVIFFSNIYLFYFKKHQVSSTASSYSFQSSKEEHTATAFHTSLSSSPFSTPNTPKPKFARMLSFFISLLPRGLPLWVARFGGGIRIGLSPSFLMLDFYSPSSREKKQKKKKQNKNENKTKYLYAWETI
jgi:hypothetical protein